MAFSLETGISNNSRLWMGKDREAKSPAGVKKIGTD
jgi:hypothetical protein